MSIGYRQCLLYENVSIEIRIGEINNIIGENGSGKSTFYKTIAGEIPPLSGKLPDGFRNHTAIISDYISLPEEMTVNDFFDFIGVEKQEFMRKKYPTLFDTISILVDQQIKTLSTGQKRILEIFSVLSSDKSIIILDEACNGLDYQNRDFFLDCIKELSLKNDVTILHTSHNLEDIIKLGGQIFLLDKDEKKIHTYQGELKYDCLNHFMKSILGGKS